MTYIICLTVYFCASRTVELCIMYVRIYHSFMNPMYMLSIHCLVIFNDEFDLFHVSLRWRHNDHAGVSNHQPPGCLLNRLFRRKSKKTSKLRVTGLCAGNSPGTGEFSAQMASYAENVSIWWRHHVPYWNVNIHLVDGRYQFCDTATSKYV